MTIDIYRSAAVILSPSIDQGTTLTKSLNGEDYITANFSLDSFTEILIGDYITFRGNTYTVRQAPDFKKISESEYQYSVRFDGPQYSLLDAMYLLDGDMEFYLTGTAEDFIDLIVTNINRVAGAGTYSTGSVDTTDIKILHFNGENCLQVLQRICEEYELEFYFGTSSPVTINLTAEIGNATGLSYQYKSGLYNIKRTKVNNSNLITRLYPYGSEKNLGPDYIDRRTRTPLGAKLRLDFTSYPDNYIEQNVATYGVKEATKEFPDIYPRFSGAVDSTSDMYHVVDASIDFDLNSYLIEGVTAKIVFLTGDLSGYEFEIISFNNSTKEVYFKKTTDDQGYEWPSATYSPSVGDEFTFIDIKMPPAYINAAEAELLSAATDYLDQASTPNVIYDIELDWHELKSGAVTLDVGDVITVTDTDLAPSGISVRIVELTQRVDNPYKYTVKLSNTLLVNYFQKINSSIASLQRDISVKRDITIERTIINQAQFDNYYSKTEADSRYVNADGDSITGDLSVTGTLDAATLNTGQGDNELFPMDQAVRSVDPVVFATVDTGQGANELYPMDQAVRVTDSPTFDGLTVTNSATIGTNIGSPSFTSGFAGSGWQYTGADGHLTIDQLTVRGTMNVYELMIQQIRASNGSIWVSDAMRYETDNGSDATYWRIGIDTDGGNRAVPFQAGDIIKCQKWTGASVKSTILVVGWVDTVNGYVRCLKSSQIGDDPEIGDDFVRIGSTTDASRRGALYLTASDTGAPFMDVVNGLSTAGGSLTTKVRVGKLDGITDTDAGLDGTQTNYFGIYTDNGHFKGHLYSTSGEIAGFTLSASDGLYAGSGATRVQMKPGAGIWAGADAIGSAPFSVTQAGALTASNATISSSPTGQRIVIDGANNKMSWYDSSNNEVVVIDDSVYGASPGIKVSGTLGTVSLTPDLLYVSTNSIYGAYIKNNTDPDGVEVYGAKIEMSGNTGTSPVYGIYVESTAAAPNGGAGIRVDYLASGGTAYGVMASASGGSTNWAGHFTGDLYVSGKISLGAEIKTAGGTLNTSGTHEILSNVPAGRVYKINAIETDVNLGGDNPRHVSAIVKTFYNAYDNLVKAIITTVDNDTFYVTFSGSTSTSCDINLTNVQASLDTIWTAIRLN